MDIFWGILGLIFLVVGGAYLQYKTNIYWKMVGRAKWRKLQPQLRNIKDIHDQITGAGKKINGIKKICLNFTKKKISKSFYSSKQEYVKYIDFCNSKHLRLPANQAELEKLIDTTEDALLNSSEALDKKLEDTIKQYDTAYTFVSEAGKGLLAQRQETVRVIEDVERLINSIACHPKSFETDIHEIIVQKEQFKTTIEYGLEQRKALETSAKSASAGVAAGAGGGGMAAGHALLALAGPIGWGVAGTSLVVSVWFAWRKKHKIQESKKEEIARLKKCVEALKEIKRKIDVISVETSSLFSNLRNSLSSYNYLRGRDYTSFSDKEKQVLGSIVNNAKALSALLTETIAE